MTDKEKLEKIKKLADAMYYAAFNLITDASLLRKAMKEYRQFIIHEYHKEEPVSEEWIKELRTKLDSMSKEDFKKVFDKYAVDFNEEPISGELEKHLWKPADGDDLPDIDREVIALLNNGKVVFAHRPYKGKYIGKNLTTGNIETFENKTYDKGGWNIPDIVYWLDVELPKEVEL
jgi:hypothetical protein